LGKEKELGMRDLLFAKMEICGLVKFMVVPARTKQVLFGLHGERKYLRDKKT